MPESHERPDPEAFDADGPESADESFLDDLFERALACAERGEALDLAGLLAGREHLREEAEQAARAAREVLGATRPRERPPLRAAGYAIERELGRGSLGSVYLARQEALGGRRVALKVLPPSAALSERARSRFLAEARALARLAHPNVVSVHEVIESGELAAYSMEWIDGASLADLIAAQRASGSPPSIEAAARRLGGSGASLGASWTLFVCSIGIRIARALEAVHAAGLLHRDVKPSNVLLRRDGSPLLSDFGLVRDEESNLHTRTGQYLGTPAYSSPEQLRGDTARVGPASDVYSLGAALYEAFSLHLPHAGRSPAEILARAETGLATPLRRRDRKLSRDLETILAKCLDPDPARRYASADELADELERVVRLEPIRARPAGPIRRAAKWARRHRRALLASSAAALAAAIPATWAGMRIAGVDRCNQRALELVRQAQVALLDPRYGLWVFNAIHPEFQPPPVIGLARRAREPLELYARALALGPSAEVARGIVLERDCVELAARISTAAATIAVPPAFAQTCPLTSQVASAWEEREELMPAELAAAETVDRRHLGLLAFLLGDARLSIEAWSSSAMRFPADGLAHASLGDLYLTLEAPELAYACLGLACAAYPEAGYLRVMLADAAVRNGHLDVGERLLDEAESLALPDPFATVTRVRADIAAARGDSERARELYEQMMSTFCTPGGLRGYARFLEDQGDFEGALRILLALANYRTEIREYRDELIDLAEVWWQSLPPEPTWRTLRSLLDQPYRTFGSFFVLLSIVGAGADAAGGSLDSAPRAELLPSPIRQRPSLAALAPGMETDPVILAETLSMPRLLKDAQALAWVSRSPRAVGALLRRVSRAWAALRGAACPALVTLSMGPLTPAQTCSSSSTYTDGDFSAWSSFELYNVGSSGGASQVGGGGNPGAAWSIHHSVGAQPNAGFTLGHTPTAPSAQFDPIALGGITGIELGMDADVLSISPPGFFGAVVGFNWILVQDGVTYYGPSSTYAAVDVSAPWTTLSTSTLSATDFTDAGGAHPNFSSGSPIVLGFFSSNGNSTGVPPGGTSDSLADNFQVTVHHPVQGSYCSAGTSASGCQALLSSSGTASATAPSGFSLIASTVEGQKDGLFFFGTNGKQANQWGNGTSFQCVVPPVKRTQLLAGTGTLGACDGSFGFDLNAHWTAKPTHNPGAGSLVRAQLWYRDPNNTSNQSTSFSDALEFLVCQ